MDRRIRGVGRDDELRDEDLSKGDEVLVAPSDGNQPSSRAGSVKRQKWGWWIGTIVLPILLFLLPYIMGGPKSSDRDGSASTQSTSSSPPSSSETLPPSATATSIGNNPVDDAAVRLVAHTMKVNVNENIDLDVVPPVSPGGNGEDVFIGENTIQVDDQTLAALASGTPPSSESQCLERSEKNGKWFQEFERGAQFCGRTDEGRTFYLRVIEPAQATDDVSIEVTVWELSS
ncbi:hypothetical protein [Saccharopolyspora sp. 5N708]|uniref:hypothetical protein n=1 Tax=Saccharopolyspora sp. 5N708 TaxID=3457424 RepID=UPI003FD2CF2C